MLLETVLGHLCGRILRRPLEDVLEPVVQSPESLGSPQFQEILLEPIQ
jgi:hypothetical protein